MRRTIYAKYVKRILDILLSLLALLVLSPVFAVVAVLVRIKLGRPVVFHQERPGYREKIFGMMKFRTMTEDKDKDGNLLPDEKRLTAFGRGLRASSLDELPELVNILKGDMSIVGPRPLAKVYLPYYYEHERARHFVKPGLTGLAQVKGRNSLSWEEKFKYDIEYVSNISFWLDIKIVFMTVAKVLKRSDIGQAEEAPESLHILRGARQTKGEHR